MMNPAMQMMPQMMNMPMGMNPMMMPQMGMNPMMMAMNPMMMGMNPMMGTMPMMMCEMTCTMTASGMTCEMKPATGMDMTMFMECCKRMTGMMGMGMPMMMSVGGMPMMMCAMTA